MKKHTENEENLKSRIWYSENTVSSLYLYEDNSDFKEIFESESLEISDS